MRPTAIITMLCLVFQLAFAVAATAATGPTAGSIAGVASQAWSWWNGLSPTTRMLFVAAAAGLVTGGATWLYTGGILFDAALMGSIGAVLGGIIAYGYNDYRQIQNEKPSAPQNQGGRSRMSLLDVVEGARP